MSFQATHLAFANEIKNNFKIKDLNKYFSGVLYPDSRYITKIPREKTHADARIPLGQIKQIDDDFLLGWQVHLWYDKLALPNLDLVALGHHYNKIHMKNLKIWIKVTAVKMIEDFYFWQNTDWSKILPHLTYRFNANNEPMNLIDSWYNYFQNCYKRKPDFNVYQEQAIFMGIPKEKAAETFLCAKKFIKEGKGKNISNIFKKVKKEFLSKI
ncbi:hypothetical protein JW977_04730 [Candidatus Falkowbacteria bacterium]|nr:hypothetical protein [Candidatus Falkowbacteria bacterium]